MSSEMRAQSGIDDILRSEGLHGGITELRSLMRGQANLITSAVTSLPAVRKPVEAAPPPPPPAAESPAPAESEPAEEDPYANLDVDTVRESPPEGPDSYGAIPDDLLDDGTVEPEPEPIAAAPDDAAPQDAGAAPPNAEAAPPTADPAAAEPEVAPAPLVGEPPAPEAQTTS